MNKYLDLFLNFLKIGATTFGGGYAMISNVQEIIVEKKKWITSDELVDLIAVAESTPGPIAINMATFIGYKKGGILGAILATLGVTIPSLVIITILTYLFNIFIGNAYVSYAFKGIKVAVAFLILRAGIKLYKQLNLLMYQKILFGVALVSAFVIDIFSLNFSAFFVLLIGGVVGYLLNLLFSIKKGKI